MSIVKAVAAEPARDDGGLLLGLADRAGVRIRRLLLAYVAGQSVAAVAKRWYDKAKARTTYTVAVPGDDELFEDVHHWLIARIPPERRRAEMARLGRRGGPEELTPVGERRPAKGVRLTYDGTATQTVDLEGHHIKVHVDRPDMGGRLGNGPPPAWIADLYRVVFTCGSVAARDAVEHMLEEMARRRSSEPRRVLVANRWSWNRQPTATTRPLESVVLAAGAMERLVDDLGQFLTQEAEYGRFGVPWHRGYLFEGPPGCGKTSAAKALADHFGLDVYYMPLAVVEDDSRLVTLLNEVEPRSLLLLEDVDVVHATRVRDDTAAGVTLSGLLNGLDGLVTPHGLVTVMTTNEPDVLDAALVRPGRVDVREHFGPADDEQVRRLLTTLLSEAPNLPFLPAPIAPARLVDIFKRHLGSPAAARADLVTLLEQGAIFDPEEAR